MDKFWILSYTFIVFVLNIRNYYRWFDKKIDEQFEKDIEDLKFTRLIYGDTFNKVIGFAISCVVVFYSFFYIMVILYTNNQIMGIISGVLWIRIIYQSCLAYLFATKDLDIKNTIFKYIFNPLETAYIIAFVWFVIS
jgi:hypothetical protein